MVFPGGDLASGLLIARDRLVRSFCAAAAAMVANGEPLDGALLLPRPPSPLLLLLGFRATVFGESNG